jgi:hypothetical protein
LDNVVFGIRDRLRILPVAVQICCLYLGWAGRQMAIVNVWRILDRSRTSQFYGVEADGTERRKLAGPGRPTRWENMVESLIGAHWVDYCLDQAGWAKLKIKLALETFSKLLHTHDVQLHGCRPNSRISPTLQVGCPKLKVPFDICVLHLADNMQPVAQTSGLWGPSDSWHCDAASTQMRYDAHALETNARVVK